MVHSSRFRRFFCTLLFVFVNVPGTTAAHAQTTLTGAIQFSASSTGTFSLGQSWNTFGLDSTWNLWLALNPDATSPVNGPTDAQAGISIPLDAGKRYRYYVFGQPNIGFDYNGLNLFFDGNVAPGISVYGAFNQSRFVPNRGSTLTLQGAAAAGAGAAAYRVDGVVVVLTGYSWNSPATPPGDVCQEHNFAPGDGADFFGSFALDVFPAAAVHARESSDPPGATIVLAGSAFAAAETVDIYADEIGSTALATATTDGTGAFAKSFAEPQSPYGYVQLYALGRTSGRLGFTSLAVTPAVAAGPEAVEPGGTTLAQGVGFGAGEKVNVYLDIPRVLLGTATASRFGSFVGTSAVTVTLPEDTSLGTNALIGIGQRTNAVGIGKLTVE